MATASATSIRAGLITDNASRLGAAGPLTLGRPCTGEQQDYDVVFRWRKVGRAWEHDYTGAVSGEMARWAVALVFPRR
jgi:hypothetical protein